MGRDYRLELGFVEVGHCAEARPLKVEVKLHVLFLLCCSLSQSPGLVLGCLWLDWGWFWFAAPFLEGAAALVAHYFSGVAVREAEIVLFGPMMLPFRDFFLFGVIPCKPMMSFTLRVLSR